MMRILLACLMCEILPISQAWAIDGGPFDGGGTRVNVVGTYAGVFAPKSVNIGEGVSSRDNSLGLFTASVPSTGLATGTASVFRNGYAYPGTIEAVADPDSAKMRGV